MDWHRLFGLILTDFFAGTPFVVELEKDLALKKQLLDVVVLRRGPGRFAGPLDIEEVWASCAFAASARSACHRGWSSAAFGPEARTFCQKDICATTTPES